MDEILDKVKLNYALSKKEKYGFIVRKTPDFDFEECDMFNYLTFKKYNKYVKEFANIFDKEFQEKQKSCFNKNVKNLKIKETKLKFIDYLRIMRGSGIKQGGYDSKKNLITVVLTSNEQSEIRSTIMHELLHVASTKTERFCGFSQEVDSDSKTSTIGYGINEGYTEYLNRQYFSKKVDHNVYDKEVTLASYIEELIGKEKMRNLYFSSDLLGLVKHLRIYEPDINKVSNLIINIDRLRFDSDYDKNRERYNNIKDQLCEMYNRKINYEYTLGLIDDNEYERKIFLHIDRFKNSDIVYTDNAIVKEYLQLYTIKDKNIREVLLKEDKKIRFRPDQTNYELSLVEDRRFYSEKLDQEEKNDRKINK